MSRHGSIFIVAAPSGAGKTSLVKGLVSEMENITVAVSHTTRPMRPGEEDGMHYYFVSKDEFKEMQGQGAFIESAQVFENWYGTSKSSIEHAIARGDDIILEIDWQGAEQVRRLFPNVSISIFILPPSKESLRRRLEQRAQDHHEVIAKRMDAAKNEIAHFSEFDYLIVNDQFDIALADFKAIVRAHRLIAKKQVERHSVLLQELLA